MLLFKQSFLIWDFTFKMKETMQYCLMLDTLPWNVSVSLRMANNSERDEAAYINYRWTLNFKSRTIYVAASINDVVFFSQV